MGRTGWRRRGLPGGLAWHYIGRNRRNKESLRHSSFLSTHLSASAFAFFLFSHHIWTHSVLFFHFQQLFFLPAHALCSLVFYSFSVIVLHLSAAHSFHFCLFVCVLSILSLLHLLRERAWHEICASAVEIVLPYQESGCRTQTVAECAREMAPHWSQWLQRIMNICLLPPTHPGPVPFSLLQFMGITLFQIKVFWRFLLISSTKLHFYLLVTLPGKWWQCFSVAYCVDWISSSS